MKTKDIKLIKESTIFNSGNKINESDIDLTSIDLDQHELEQQKARMKKKYQHTRFQKHSNNNLSLKNMMNVNQIVIDNKSMY